MENQKIRNIACIRSDRFGEFLLSLYAVRLVKLDHPLARIHLFAQKDNLELVRGIDCVDSYLEYSEKRFGGFSGAVRLAGVLRKVRCDCVIVFNPKKEFHLAAVLSGARLRIGYDRKWGFCLNKKIPDIKAGSEKHEVECNLDLARLLCPRQETPSVVLPLDSEESLEPLSGLFDRVKKYIVVHPFTSHAPKKIEHDFWIALATALRAKGMGDMVLIGSPSEREESGALARAMGAGNLTGAVSLRNLAVFLKHHCRAFIGLDSGPMHLASMVGIPVAGLFRASDEKRWGPYRTESIIVKEGDLRGFTGRIDAIVRFAAQQA